MAKTLLIKKTHKTKKPTKFLWVRANPWASFLNKNNILLFLNILLNFRFRSACRSWTIHLVNWPDLTNIGHRVNSLWPLAGLGCRSRMVHHGRGLGPAHFVHRSSLLFLSVAQPANLSPWLGLARLNCGPRLARLFHRSKLAYLFYHPDRAFLDCLSKLF